jgi:hypothetical protein
MKNNGSSERHQNNNLNVIIELSNYFGPDIFVILFFYLFSNSFLCLFIPNLQIKFYNNN